MITYDKGCMGLWLLLRIVGTTWPAAIWPGLLAVGISLFMGLYEDIDAVTRDRDRRSTFVGRREDGSGSFGQSGISSTPRVGGFVR
eukprot:Skav202987  [mRNA]  locus=scaffold2267:251599:255732:- [translate_table: standard]